MRVRGHGTGVAIALAAIAVVAAGTGTAVAVSSSVSIVDATVPARTARVDADGRLATSGATSTIAVSRNLDTPAAGASTDLTAPTTATLAISRVAVGNPLGNAGSTYTVFLEQHGVVNGVCARATAVLLARYEVAAGDYRNDALPQPIVVKPTGGAPYCVSVFAFTSNGQTDTGGYYAWVDLAASVVSGRYIPVAPGAAAAPVEPRQSKTER